MASEGEKRRRTGKGARGRRERSATYSGYFPRISRASKKFARRSPLRRSTIISLPNAPTSWYKTSMRARSFVRRILRLATKMINLLIRPASSSERNISKTHVPARHRRRATVSLSLFLLERDALAFIPRCPRTRIARRRILIA